MKLDDAIETLGDSCWDYIPESETDIRDAIKLGIEALKDIKALRLLYFDPPRELLPGETRA